MWPDVVGPRVEGGCLGIDEYRIWVEEADDISVYRFDRHCLGTARACPFSKPIGEVHSVEVFSTKKITGNKGKPQNTATKVVVINERDIFNFSTPFRDRAIVNGQLTLLHSLSIKLEDVRISS